jgi:hypothetical protein
VSKLVHGRSLSRYRRNNVTSDSAKVIIVEYPSSAEESLPSPRSFRRSLSTFIDSQRSRRDGQWRSFSCHRLATKKRTLMRVIAITWEADSHQSTTVTQASTTAKNKLQALKEPQASMNIPLHIPEPLSMTRAAISSSSDMVKVVLLLLLKGDVIAAR